MNANVNTVLADCEKQVKALVEEIEKYKAAGVISNQAATSLDAVCVSLGETQKRIKPFTAIWSRRIMLISGILLGSNIVLSLGIVYLIMAG